MLTRLEEIKLSLLKKTYGDLTVDGAREEADWNKERAQGLSPFDPAYARFHRIQRELENYATLLKKSQKAADAAPGS